MEANFFPDDKYAEEKLNKGIKILKDNYFKSSVIEKIVTVKDATNGEGFGRLGFRHLIPKEWFTDRTHYTDLVFEQLGDNLAHSEYKIVIDRIFKNGDFPEVDITEKTPENLVENYKSFSETKKVDALLAPINFYVDMHTEWNKIAPDYQIDFATGEIFIVEAKQTIFWSNKYVPFDDFVFLDKRFSEMTFKPSFRERLDVKIAPSEKINMLDLSFSIVLKFDIVDKSKILVLHSKKNDQ